MTLRVGFFGGGFIARYHAAMLERGDADVELVGVHDPDDEKATGFADATGAPVITSEDELFDAADAVYVCTWTSEHARLVTAAAARGLAVFCEKPLAVDLAGATAMLDAVRGAGVVNQVGLVLRDTPPFQLLRHFMQRPENGRIMAVVLRDDQFLPVQGLYESTWRGDPERAGAGTLLEHSIHDVDLLEWFAGPIAAGSASAATFHGIEGIEDAVVAELRFASGALGSLVSVWHDVLERPSMRRVEVFCERAHAWLDDDERGSVHVTRTGGDAETVRQADLVGRLSEAGIAVRNPDAAFVDAVVRGEPAWPDLAVAWRAHVVTDALYASAAAGGSIREVPPLPELSNRPSA